MYARFSRLRLNLTRRATNGQQQLARVIAAGTVRAAATRRCAACGGGADCVSCNDCRGLLKTTLRDGHFWAILQTFLDV